MAETEPALQGPIEGALIDQDTRLGGIPDLLGDADLELFLRAVWTASCKVMRWTAGAAPGLSWATRPNAMKRAGKARKAAAVDRDIVTP